MQPGDLVNICCEEGGPVSVGEDNGMAGLDVPIGTLYVYLGMNRKWSRHRPAVDILIDGARGWVWQNEIVPATCATPS